jgi:hypothetical protein
MSLEDDRVMVAARAAVDVAARCGVQCACPRLLHHSNNIVWHLAPAPVVAKVAASGHRKGGPASLTRELEVARFLAARDAPTTRPSCVLPAGPHQAHGAVVSLWEYCVHDASVEVDAGSAIRALAEVHAALAGYDGLLPSFTIQIEDAGRILADHPLPALASDDRAFLTETHLRLCAALAGRPLVMRPLHGEAHLGNVLATPAGPRWTDFEASCLGPVEWDLAGLGEDALDPSAHVDRDLLELMGRLRSLCVAVWCWMNPDRAPELREAAEHHLHRLQAHG